MMTFPGHNPHLFRWKRFDKSKTADKMHVKNWDIDQWRKRVEVASEFAVSEVFSNKKPHLGTNSLAVPLQSTEQIRDHDDAYSEAQALLGDWLNSKLRLELEVEEEDDLVCSSERRSSAALAISQPAALNFSNFDDLYNCLAEEEEHSAVNSFLQDLMEQEVLDSGAIEELAMDVGQTRKKFRDPTVTMEARHLQVRENRARQEAERQRQQREREARRGAIEEAKRRERVEDTWKKQQGHRQEEMVQQEMVRLRRQMEERRSLEQLVRQRERERMERQRAARSLQSAPQLSTKEQQRDTEKLFKEQKIQTMVLMGNLKVGSCTRHFSKWYSVVLARRLRLGKAMALCDWKRQLRAWRAWRAVVWAEQQQREVARTEENLRLAVESDRRRLLRRCLNEWQLWCRMEKEQQELFAQQQETRRKMAALINAASTGKLKATETPIDQPIMAPPEASNQPETTEKNKTPVGAVAQPTQPWQVTRQHAAPTAAELKGAQQRCEGSTFKCSKSTVPTGSKFQNRHATQQQIITQQRKLLKEQQEQIAQLKEEQSVTGGIPCAQLTHLPLFEAMEARSRQRAERRKEIEGLKKKKEEEKLREEEKQRQLKRQQELLKLAHQHHHRNLLLRRGLVPWKRLIELRQANIQLAENHHNLFLLGRCTLGWHQSARESLTEKEASADQLHQHFLLRRSLSYWKRLKDWRMIQKERAEQFYRTRTLRGVLLALLHHVTQERLVDWDRQELAQEHNNRRVLRRCLLAWRQFPCLLRKERVREERREKLGRRVTAVLPDFSSYPL
ncbi:hypothetical protein FQN60_013705 [Etheostoma spectabile]|uniref:Sfi1 spindle body domain-containing protein n=1 Tax=Etheostoma spectabile TaxID=54343 RepID=A0A5J5CG79_9PERO|nr:hypothetical protein FQN60_013705 [Etheostoma spectabile]